MQTFAFYRYYSGMAKFIYLGADNTFVGRFGRLKHGAVINLWQSEVDYILATGSKKWKPVDEEVDATGVGTVLPAKTRWFDLTSIYWLKEARYALNRLSRPELVNACRAMRDLGATVPDEDSAYHSSREALVEELYGEAKRLKWDQPGYGPVNRNRKKIDPDSVVVKTEPTDIETEIGTKETEEASEVEEHAGEETGGPVVPVAKKLARKVATKAAKPDPSYRTLRRESKQ